MRVTGSELSNHVLQSGVKSSISADEPGSVAKCADEACRGPTSEYVEGYRDLTSVNVGVKSLSPGTTGQKESTSEDSTDSCGDILKFLGVSVKAADSADLRVWQNVCRLQGETSTPMRNPEEGRTVALPAAAGGGIRDDMFFVGIQIQNR